jgi:hypothetical protein
MPALGGHKPSELMAAMLETCPRGEEKTNLFACIFLQRLPREIRVLLAKADHKDPKTLATQADKLWALHDTTNNGGGVAAVQETPDSDFVAAISGDRRRGGGAARGKTRGGGRGRGGKAAPRAAGAGGFQGGQAGRRPLHQALEIWRGRLFLRAALQLAGKGRCRGQLNAVVPGELLHLTDSLTGRSFLVDTGASFSIFPHLSADPGSGPALRSLSGPERHLHRVPVGGECSRGSTAGQAQDGAPHTDRRAAGHRRFRRLDLAKLAAAKAEFSKLEKDGIIRRSSSNWSAPLHMVMKPDGTWRPCGNYRRLNLATTPDSYPLQNIQDLSSRLHGCSIFSKLDLRKGYYQIPVQEGDIHKTAVITPFGLWKFLRMPFGLCNAGQSFQRFMDEVLSGLDFAFCYLDDILIGSSSTEEHMQHLHLVLQRLQEYGLVLNMEKCELARQEINFLGHHITAEGALPILRHVQAIQDTLAKVATLTHPDPAADLSLAVDASNTHI